jgi:hypothetical protein
MTANIRTGGEVGNHSLRMDPGIRSAGAMQIYLFPGHPRKAMFNFPLNGTFVSLALPAAK